ncbi:MAG: DUF1850 domain-containing protein [Desulfovibrio sp.]|nr:DUF1850 domain-containing protein [Desulfovibrio sp.]
MLALLMLPAPVMADAMTEHIFLQVKNTHGNVVFSIAVKAGASFGIRFVHSVAKSPVEEWFTIQNGTIFLEKTVYQDFGAGLPHEPGSGQRMTCSNGRICISGYHRHLPSFDVRVGRIAQHALLLPARDDMAIIPLTCLAAPGDALTFALSNTAAKP